jgi:hypothetical protein
MSMLHSPQWQAKVRELSEIAQAQTDPSLHSRIQMATTICLHGDIQFDADGTCHVLSSDKSQWYLCNGSCDCEAHQYHPTGYQCKHLLAKRMALKAQELCQAPTTAEAPRSPQVQRTGHCQVNEKSLSDAFHLRKAEGVGRAKILGLVKAQNLL